MDRRELLTSRNGAAQLHVLWPFAPSRTASARTLAEYIAARRQETSARRMPGQSQSRGLCAVLGDGVFKRAGDAARASATRRVLVVDDNGIVIAALTGWGQD